MRTLIPYFGLFLATTDPRVPIPHHKFITDLEMIVSLGPMLHHYYCLLISCCSCWMSRRHSLPALCVWQVDVSTTRRPSIMECTLTQVIALEFAKQADHPRTWLEPTKGTSLSSLLLLIFKTPFLFPPPSWLTIDTRYDDFATLCTAESLLGAPPLRGQKGHPCRLYPKYVIISPSSVPSSSDWMCCRLEHDWVSNG